ncbi:hypothetical protein DPMN_123100 [Dreissena polymorpha]|uniref:Uncharacterized protein n=1 Tax=Dreissena polymorpha TaxID=45954 RepID=A0A9D4GQZ0_DREPO|nr:hypothetical protein DPMN_123100 [Dreissena polymorpha]
MRNARRLAGSTYAIDREYPDDIRSARKRCWLEYKKYRENKLNRVQLRFPASLYVNDRYSPSRGGVGLQSASQTVSRISMTVKPSPASLSQPTQRDALTNKNVHGNLRNAHRSQRLMVAVGYDDCDYHDKDLNADTDNSDDDNVYDVYDSCEEDDSDGKDGEDGDNDDGDCEDDD